MASSELKLNKIRDIGIFDNSHGWITLTSRHANNELSHGDPEQLMKRCGSKKSTRKRLSSWTFFRMHRNLSFKTCRRVSQNIKKCKSKWMGWASLSLPSPVPDMGKQTTNNAVNCPPPPPPHSQRNPRSFPPSFLLTAYSKKKKKKADRRLLPTGMAFNT